MVKDFGRELRGIVLADSTAALAIADRKGSGKLRHIKKGLLWIQETKAKEELIFESRWARESSGHDDKEHQLDAAGKTWPKSEPEEQRRKSDRRVEDTRG